MTRQINKLYTDGTKLFKSERYLNTPIEESTSRRSGPQLTGSTYKTMATDPKSISAQKEAERPERPAAREDDRPPRHGKKREYQDRNALGRLEADRNKKPRRDPSPPKHKKPDARTPRREPPPPSQIPPQAPAAASDICIRNLFHHADSAACKLPCKRKPCPRDHNPTLRNVKLDEADKKAVRANLQLMEGKFATHAL